MQKMTINTTLNFDDSERSVVENLMRLKDQHRVGEYISYCVKNTTALKEFNEKVERTKVQLMALQEQINKISEIANKTYCLLEVGKRLGLEEQPKSLLASQFILQRKLNEINDILGVDISEVNTKDITSFGDEATEYILTSYDSMLKEFISAIPVSKVSAQDDNSASLTDNSKAEVEEVQIDMNIDAPDEDEGVEFIEDNMDDLMSFTGLDM